MSPCLWMHVTRRTGCFLSLSPGSFSLSFDSFLRCRGRSALSDAPSLCALRVRQWAADRGPCLPSGSAQRLSCAVEWSWRVGFFLREPPDVRILAGLFFSGSVPPERHSCPRGRLGREDPARMRSPLPPWVAVFPALQPRPSGATEAQSPWKSKPVSPHTFLF